MKTKFSLYAASLTLAAASGVAQTAPATPADHVTRFVPGLDIEGQVNAEFSGWRSGGTTSIALGTTACNPGTVQGVWEAAPDPDHPFICQMYARLHEGRFEQISDWSYVKHSFGSTNSPGCSSGTCQSGAAFNRLGLNCSDTYGSSLNGSRGDLGPPWEINGWTGEWNMFGSHLDTGFPVTAPDGASSQINPNSVIQFRVQIPESKIGTPGASYFAACYYLHKWEPEANRGNNMSSRVITLTPGNASSTSGRLFGSILETRYTGARVESAANVAGGLARDGRFYLGVNVRDNGDGSYRYEYVVHNRDNHGGNAELRIPICPTGTFFNAGFKDLDQNAGNDWTISRIGDEIVFAAPMGNAQPWNTLYNFWFDSDTGPGDADATIFQGTINPGANGSLTIPTDAPVLDANINLGGGCGMPHVLAANGRATIPNPSLALTVDNIGPGQVTALHVNFNGNSVSLFPPLGLPTCDLLSPEFSLPGIAFGGIAFWQFPIPNTPSAEGSSIFYQVAIGQPGGAVLGIADLSNKLQLRVGNNVTGCQ